MGNWMTVRIVGTCNVDDVRALREEVNFDLRAPDADYEKFGPLTSCGGLCGLPAWAGETIDVTGNCAERDYDPESIAEHLIALAKVAPSLSCKVHCGGEQESKEVIATVTLAGGAAVVGEPEIAKLGEMPPGQMEENMRRMLMG